MVMKIFTKYYKIPKSGLCFLKINYFHLWVIGMSGPFQKFIESFLFHQKMIWSFKIFCQQNSFEL